MDNTIQVGGALIPGSVDTPLDARARVNTLDDVPGIPLPYIGMEFFVAATGRKYIVKSLKTKKIGAAEVENAEVDIYEPSGGGAVLPGKLMLIKPIAALPLWPVVDAFPDKNFTESAKVKICSKTEHPDRVAAWSGTAWNTLTSEGLTDAYKNMPVEIDISDLELAEGYFRYYWIDGDGKTSDVLSLPFPAITEPTPFHLRAITGENAGVKIKFIGLAEYNALVETDPLTLYFVNGLGIVFNGIQYSTSVPLSGGTE